MSFDVKTAVAASPKVRSREVRIGLVMYGGVSLAVYINGVSQELFRAVRGRGAYRLLKVLTDSDIVIDVLSGTSAGGINGIMLAFALCNEREFGSSAELWRSHGDIGQLLRDGSGRPREMASLLDSEDYYQPKLEEAFQKLWDQPIAEASEDPSAMPELDLFVTGTDFHGRTYDEFDDLGHRIPVRDHRVLFWLKHRGERKQPFHPWADERGRLSGAIETREKLARHAANIEALAKLARITSCFPAAFAPVTVEGGPAGCPADQRLSLWGNLDRTTVLIDGGVLDNKPFTSTLDAIFHRTSERAVSRFLVYVEPDPEGFGLGKPGDAATPPNAVRAALDSVTRIPGYESIADDLRSIMEHNNQIERYHQLLPEAQGSPGPAPAREPDESARESWSGREFYQRARLLGLCEAVLDAASDALRLRAAAGGLQNAEVQRLSMWLKEGPFNGETEIGRLLEELDVDFRLRRLFHLTYLFDSHEGLLSIVNAQIQLLEIVRSRLQDRLALLSLSGVSPEMNSPDAGTAIRAFWGVVHATAMEFLTDAKAHLPASYRQDQLGGGAPALLTSDQLTAFAAKLESDSLRASDATPWASRSPSFLELTDAFERECIRACGEQYFAAYRSFEEIDSVQYPLELVSGLRQKDVIRIVRFSPRDATRGLSARSLEQKVCGVRLGHFAAFFKRAWRSNDILAGRLDATCQLIETLLDRERVGHVMRDAERRAELRVLVGSRESPGELAPEKVFSKSPPELQAALRAWLMDLSDDSVETHQKALALIPDRGSAESPAADDLVSRLVLAAQLEVLPESLHPVLDDAIEEQLEWNILRTTATEDASPSVAVSPGSGAFVRGRGRFDSTVAMLASGELAKRGFDGMGPQERRDFFLHRYGVGSERIETHIPRLVLLDLFARALLVIRNNLLGALGPRAETVSRQLLFRLFLDWPFRVLALITGGLRRSPARQSAFVVGALGYVALAVAVLILGGKTIIYKNGQLSSPSMLLFVVVPVVLIGVIAGLLDRDERTTLGRRIWHSAKMMLALGAALAGTVTLGGLLFSPTHGVSWLTRLTALPGVSAVAWLPKVLALVLPLATGVWLGRRRSSSRQAEQASRLRERLKSRPQHVSDLWDALTEGRKRPWFFGWRGRRALVKVARREGKLDVLERMMAAGGPGPSSEVPESAPPPSSRQAVEANAQAASASGAPARLDTRALRDGLDALPIEQKKWLWNNLFKETPLPRWFGARATRVILARATRTEQLAMLRDRMEQLPRTAPPPLN